MDEPLPLSLSVDLTPEERGALERRFPAPDGLAVGIAKHLRRIAAVQLDTERRASLRAAGHVYTARYHRYGSDDEETFVDAGEAWAFLDYGDDNGHHASEGVFDWNGTAVPRPADQAS